MAWDINHVILVGRLVRDPELRYTSSQKPVCNFSIANSKSSGQSNQEDVNFFNIVTWNKTAEMCGQYLKKGRQIAVEGRLQQRSYNDANGQKRNVIEIIANTVQFLGGRDNAGDPSYSNTGTSTPTQIPSEEPAADDFPDFESSNDSSGNDDVPF